MNRTVKRSLERNNKLLDKIVIKMTIKRLKTLGIDFVRSGDKLISTRNKDVENVYNATMTEVLARFNKTNGSTKDMKRIYNMK